MTRTITLLISILIISTSLISQTAGELTVTTSTSSTGGNYAPKNVVAIWIEDGSGNFVKTLLAYAQNRKTHLNTWESSTSASGSIYNTTDAITGPTKTSHSTRTCYWNGTNVIGIDVPDGDYKVWMELTDKNSTGNFSSFTFTKGPDAELITPFNVPSFGSISIAWDPTSTDISDNNFNNITISPNPTNGLVHIESDDIVSVEVFDLAGTLIHNGSSTDIDLSEQPQGIYLMNIKTKNSTTNHKIIKQ